MVVAHGGGTKTGTRGVTVTGYREGRGQCSGGGLWLAVVVV